MEEQLVLTRDITYNYMEMVPEGVLIKIVGSNTEECKEDITDEMLMNLKEGDVISMTFDEMLTVAGRVVVERMAAESKDADEPFSDEFEKKMIKLIRQCRADCRTEKILDDFHKSRENIQNKNG